MTLKANVRPYISNEGIVNVAFPKLGSSTPSCSSRCNDTFCISITILTSFRVFLTFNVFHFGSATNNVQTSSVSTSQTNDFMWIHWVISSQALESWSQDFNIVGVVIGFFNASNYQSHWFDTLQSSIFQIPLEIIGFLISNTSGLDLIQSNVSWITA